MHRIYYRNCGLPRILKYNFFYQCIKYKYTLYIGIYEDFSIVFYNYFRTTVNDIVPSM